MCLVWSRARWRRTVRKVLQLVSDHETACLHLEEKYSQTWSYAFCQSQKIQLNQLQLRKEYTDKISYLLPLTIQFQPRLEGPQTTKTKCFRWLALLGPLLLLNVSDLQPGFHGTFQIRKAEILKYPKQNFESKKTVKSKIFKIPVSDFWKIRNFSQVRVSLESLFLTF